MSTETDYGIDAYKQGSSAERSSLIKELIYSEHSDKMNLLKTFYSEESDLQIKFDIRTALDDLESSQQSIPVGNEQTEIDSKIRKVLESSDASLRHKALNSVVKNRRADLLPLLKEINVKINDVYFDAAIVKLLSLNTVSNFKEILTFLDSSDDRVVATTVEVLGQVGNSQSLELVAKHLSHENNRVRANAAIALSKSDPHLALETITRMAESDVSAYRSSAAYALDLVKIYDGGQILETLMNDEDSRVAEIAYKIFQKEKAKNSLNNASSSTINNDNSEISLTTLDSINEALKNTDDNLRVSLLLGKIRECNGSNSEKLKSLIAYLNNTDDQVRAVLMELMEYFIPSSSNSDIQDFLHNADVQIIGKTISLLCVQNSCKEGYSDVILLALHSLINNHGLKGSLVAIDCIDKCRDERFAPILEKLATIEDEQLVPKVANLRANWPHVNTNENKEIDKKISKSNESTFNNTAEESQFVFEDKSKYDNIALWRFFGRRLPRKQYWIGMVLVLVIYSVLPYFHLIIPVHVPYAFFKLNVILIGLICTVLTIRRLHDCNMTGYWVIIGWLIDSFTINFLLCMLIGLFEGSDNVNRFGMSPKEKTK